MLAHTLTQTQHWVGTLIKCSSCTLGILRSEWLSSFELFLDEAAPGFCKAQGELLASGASALSAYLLTYELAETFFISRGAFCFAICFFSFLVHALEVCAVSSPVT